MFLTAVIIIHVQVGRGHVRVWGAACGPREGRRGVVLGLLRRRRREEEEGSEWATGMGDKGKRGGGGP